MKYLLQAIDARRDCVRLSDPELRDLLIEVRNGKDDRIEFTESMVRLLEELKSSEHAVAFLTKVAKRDAPDYYDVIKNPMDLGTMLRNVRSGRYKSKAQFMRDLDLIWDNCLTYNSEPTHPLRRSVQVLRNKANHLLTYVNDTNDVKEALTQWQASLGLRARATDGSTGDDACEIADTSTASLKDRTGQIAVQRMSVANLGDMPFEQRPALLRKVEGMDSFDRLNEWQTSVDRSFGERHLLTQDRRTFDDYDQQEASLSANVDIAACEDMLKTLEGPDGGVLRQALTRGGQTDASHPAWRNGGSALDEAAERGAEFEAITEADIPYPFERPEGAVRAAGYPLHSAGSWWNSMSHPSMLPSGYGILAKAKQLPAARYRFVPTSRRKRRSSHVQHDSQSHEDRDNARKNLAGGAESVRQNVRTISQLRRIHNKFGRLQHHIESGEPMPADLAVVSDDEDQEESGDPSDQRERNTRADRRQKAPDMLTIPHREMLGNPYASLGGEGALTVLQEKTDLLLAHAGFDGAQRGAADVIADVAGEYLMNLGRLLRSYSDRFSGEMTAEELILHTLHESGGIDVRSLETYVADDVVRYGHKMSELLRKLRTSYKDTLRTSDLTMADEAAYFGQREQPSGDANRLAATNGEDDEHIMPGGYAAGLAEEDFFGFKDLGLDDELGIDVGRQLATMPSRMFSRRQQEGMGGIEAKIRSGLGSGRSQSTSALDFEPPPPCIPINESAIAAQIGLMRPFLRELIRSRGQWHPLDPEDAASNEDVPMRDQDVSPSGVEGKPGYLILHDEDQERQRYKVPPTGKLPRRAMKDRLTMSKTPATSQLRAQDPRAFAVGDTARRTGDSQPQTLGNSARNGSMTKSKAKKMLTEKSTKSAYSVAAK